MSNSTIYDIPQMSDEDLENEVYDWTLGELEHESTNAQEDFTADNSDIFLASEEVDIHSINNEIFLNTISKEHSQTSMDYEADDSDVIIQIKSHLNGYLNNIKHHTSEEWNSKAKDIGIFNKLEESIVTAKQIYLSVSVKILKQITSEYNWKLAISSDKMYINTAKHWVEFPLNIQTMFFQKVMHQLGIPEVLILSSKFVKIFNQELLFNGLFKPMKSKIGTFINLQNTTLRIDLNGVKPLQHNPDDFMLYLLDYSYDPNSVNLQWTSFLNMVLPNLDTQKTLQQSIAYMFIKGLKLEKAIFLYGTGANGKSVIFEVLKGIIDSGMMTNYSLESLLDSKGYHRYNIHNKHINYGTDVTFKFLNHGIFKQLVSGEPVEARLPGRHPVIIDDYAKFIFNINTVDDANIESTIGFLRRMVFIPFETTISEAQRDKDLPQKILQNKSGVLNWILKGIQDVLNTKNIFISNQCEQFLDNFQKSSNLAIRFAEECLISNFDNEIKFQDIYDIFREYCKKQGEQPISQRKFNAELRKSVTEKRTNSNMVWLTSFNQANCKAMSMSVAF